MDLTRRHVLTGAAGIAAAPLLPAISADAAAPIADKQAPSFYRYKVGDAQVNVISDGVNTFALPETFVLNAKKDDVNAALEKAFLPKDKVSIHFAPLVINTGGKLVVVDTATARLHLLRARAMSASSPATWRLPASTRSRSTWW